MQYVAFLERSYPAHVFERVAAAHLVAHYEMNREAFDRVAESIRNADLVMWAFPLYFLLVSSGMKRFVELLYERLGHGGFAGVYAASLSTSIHFHDHTAHTYIREVSADLGMSYIDGFPAHMRDLMDEGAREALLSTADRWWRVVRDRVPIPPLAAPPLEHDRVYRASAEPVPPPATGHRGDADARTGADGDSGDDAPAEHPAVTIVADLEEARPGVASMVDRIRVSFPDARVVNLRTIKMGPCTGCLTCGADNRCVYEGKDDYMAMFRRDVLPADILVFALGAHDRSFSHLWQRYLERSFNRTHQRTLRGKQIAVLASAALAGGRNAREILEAYVETMGGTLVDVVTDEAGSDADLDRRIDALAGDLRAYAERGVHKPATFLGVGGINIFRDEIYSGLSLVFQADHAAYRRDGLYKTLPHRRPFRRLAVGLFRLVSRLGFVRRRFPSVMRDGMLRPYAPILERTQPR